MGSIPLHVQDYLLVPGGGVEPPRGCPRRILSPFSTVLHTVASAGKGLHNSLINFDI